METRDDAGVTVPQSAVETVVRRESVRARAVSVPVRRARLERFVVRERRSIEVEVAHEEFRVVYDDIEDGGPQQSEPSPRSVSTVLREERIEIVRHVVPVERITLSLVEVTDVRDLAVDVAHEVVEVDRITDGG